MTSGFSSIPLGQNRFIKLKSGLLLHTIISMHPAAWGNVAWPVRRCVCLLEKGKGVVKKSESGYVHVAECRNAWELHTSQNADKSWKSSRWQLHLSVFAMTTFCAGAGAGAGAGARAKFSQQWIN